jgi:hypothetical protein
MKKFGKELLTVGITSFVNSIIGLMFALNESETAFQRATGGSHSFAREMSNSYEVVRGHTVTLEQNQQAWSALYTSYTDFTMISPIARQEIGQTVATLNNLGVSAETSAKAMQTATVALGQTGTQAAATLVELEGYARDIGVAPAQLIEQYGTMGGSLAKLGQNGTRAFKDLARVSKITGLEMQKLLNMTDKFDTFEGAAEQAGKLNAALGTNAVNAMDLLMETDPAARFGMIRDSILESGLSFDTMSYYQRKFFAESAGLESVGDLAAVMRGDMGSLGGEIGKTAQDYADMAKRAGDVATIKEKLTAILMDLIPVFMPLIDSLDQALTAFIANKGAIIEFKDSITEMMPTANTIIEGLKKLGGLIEFVTEHWKIIAVLWLASATGVLPLLGKALGWTIVKLGSLAASETVAGSAGAAGATGLGTFALGVLGIGAGIGIAAAGIGYLLSSFQNLSDLTWGNIIKGLLATAAAIGTVAAALIVMANPVSATGAAIIAGLGVGLGATAGGIGLLMGAFKKDKTGMEDLSGVMGSFGQVSSEQFAAANVAFEQMKDSINLMNAPNLAALATTAAVLPTIVTTQAVAAASPAGAPGGAGGAGAPGGAGGAGGAGSPGAPGPPQKVDVNISFNEAAGRYFIVETLEENAIAVANGQSPRWSR